MYIMQSCICDRVSPDNLNLGGKTKTAATNEDQKEMGWFGGWAGMKYWTGTRHMTNKETNVRSCNNNWRDNTRKLFIGKCWLDNGISVIMTTICLKTTIFCLKKRWRQFRERKKIILIWMTDSWSLFVKSHISVIIFLMVSLIICLLLICIEFNLI